MKKGINLSIEEMKIIAHEIIDEEVEKYNIKLKVFPVTFVEYYNKIIFNKKISLIKRLNYFKYSIGAAGFNDSKGKTLIFLDRFKKIEKIEDKLFKLVKVCYHEARHSTQMKFDKYSYERFLIDMEVCIRKLGLDIDYIKEHDKYSFEIGANLYGVRKAREYLKSNYKDLYEKEKLKIEKLEKRYNYDYMTYDATDLVERIVSMLRKKDKINRVSVVSRSMIDEVKLENTLEILRVFLNKDNTFKSIREIMDDYKFKKLDKRIIYAVLSSKSFLEELNMDELEKEELMILSESLQYTNGVYENQSKLLDKSFKEKIITSLEYLESYKSIIKKINFINKKVIRKINFMRSERKRRNHMKSIPLYLEESNKLIKKRKNSGYLYIGFIYIVGGLISLLTIIYLLLNK